MWVRCWFAWSILPPPLMVTQLLCVCDAVSLPDSCSTRIHLRWDFFHFHSTVVSSGTGDWKRRHVTWSAPFGTGDSAGKHHQHHRKGSITSDDHSLGLPPSLLRVHELNLLPAEWQLCSSTHWANCFFFLTLFLWLQLLRLNLKTGHFDPRFGGLGSGTVRNRTSRQPRGG